MDGGVSLSDCWAVIHPPLGPLVVTTSTTPRHRIVLVILDAGLGGRTATGLQILPRNGRGINIQLRPFMCSLVLVVAGIPLTDSGGG